MGLSRGRNRNHVTSSTVRLAEAVSSLATERRAGEIEARVLDAAIAATGSAGGAIVRHSGETAARRGAPGPDDRVLRRDLRTGDGPLGRVEIWGGSPAADAEAALEVIATVGAHVTQAAQLALAARLAEARSRRIGQATSEIAAAGSRLDALSGLLAHARTLLSAPLAAVLITDAQGRLTAAVEDGVVAPEGVDTWQALPGEAADAVRAGDVWIGEVASGGESRTYAVAPLAHGETRYGALGLAGLAPPGDDELALLAEYADRAAAGIWIASLEEEVRELSTVDPVTRLYDGRYFRQRLEQEIGRSAREGTSLSVLILGLDGSDELRAQGHDAVADDALLDVAVQVGHNRRAMDVACRLTGDEIAMILPGAAGLDAILAAERIRGAVAAISSATRIGPLSVGIASYPDAGSGREELIAAGRSALGFARSYGGDRAFLYDREVAALLEADEREQIAGDDAFVATVYALAAAVDARDPSTCEHGENVARIAALIARELGLSSPRVEEIRTAGLLHDVGKIGVSDRVLRKSGSLTDEEWEEMRQHPVVAHRILAGTRLEAIRPWILHHHEHVDGTGYPEGIAGDAIPLEARIIAVAEALDAMVQGRPYRAPLSPEGAMQEIAACSGTRFDPAVVGALQALAGRGEPGVLPRPGTQ